MAGRTIKVEPGDPPIPQVVIRKTPQRAFPTRRGLHGGDPPLGRQPCGERPDPERGHRPAHGLVETLVRVAGSGRWEFVPFRPERQAQEPGHFDSDIRKIQALTGWRLRTSLEEGLRLRVDDYRLHRDHSRTRPVRPGAIRAA
jgi:hypothetical protein